MSLGELLLIFIVAIIAFGPSKLPMLATHLGMLVRKMNQLKEHISSFWQQQMNEIQLHENKRKAEEVDQQYEKRGSGKDNVQSHE